MVVVTTETDRTEEKGVNGPFCQGETSGCGREVDTAYETTAVDDMTEMAVGSDTIRTEWDGGCSGEVRMGMDDGEVAKGIGGIDEGDSLLPEKMGLHCII